VFRSFAFLLILCSVISPVRAITAAVDHAGSLPILLGVETVRTEMKLDSLQRALLDSIRDEYKSAARDLTNPMPKTAQERASAHQRLLKLNARFNNRALSVLSPAQRGKFAEIEAKFLGATMLYSPSVQARLRLTDVQKRQVEAIRQQGIAYVGKINRKFEEGKIGQPRRLQLLRNRRIEQGEEMLRLLTPEQRNAVLGLEGKNIAT
jgi:Spy/CpxP family protein refolding chaperone